MTVRISKPMRDLLKTIAALRATGALEEERFKHLTAAHHKILRELQRTSSTNEEHEFESLTSAQHEAIAAAAPLKRGRIVSSLLSNTERKE